MTDDKLSYENHLKYLAYFRWSSKSKNYKFERWVAPEKGKVLFNLIQESGAEAYFESGTANGFSTMYAALALPKDGVVHTFDPANRVKVWNDAYFDGMHYTPKINYHNSKFNAIGIMGTEEEEKGLEPWTCVRDFLPCTGPKFFFIDGDHSFSGVRKDFHSIKDHLQEGDIIVFDDVGSEKSTLKGYLDCLANMPHFITRFEVERKWISETLKIPKAKGETRTKQSSIGIIRVLKREDIPARKKDHFKMDFDG